MLGHGDRWHLESLDLVEQLPDATGAVEQRELSV